MRNEQLNTDISRCKRMRAEHFSCVWNGWLAMRLTSIFTNDSTRSPRHTHWIFHGTSAAFYTLSATGGLTQIAFFSGFFSATPQPLHAQPRVLKISWFFFSHTKRAWKMTLLFTLYSKQRYFNLYNKLRQICFCIYTFNY